MRDTVHWQRRGCCRTQHNASRWRTRAPHGVFTSDLAWIMLQLFERRSSLTNDINAEPEIPGKDWNCEGDVIQSSHITRDRWA